MNWTVALVIAGVVVFDVLLVLFLVRAGWQQIARKEFPARAPGPGAVRRNFQSISINMWNFGKCVHIAVDESHLHLIPAAFIRWAGGRAVSIPWEALEVKRLGRWFSSARFGHDTLKAPTWAIELAAAESTALESGGTGSGAIQGE